VIQKLSETLAPTPDLAFSRAKKREALALTGIDRGHISTHRDAR